MTQISDNLNMFDSWTVTPPYPSWKLIDEVKKGFEGFEEVFPPIDEILTVVSKVALGYDIELPDQP